MDCENGCLSPSVGVLNNNVQIDLAHSRNSAQNLSEKNFIFKGAII